MINTEPEKALRRIGHININYLAARGGGIGREGEEDGVTEGGGWR